MATTNTTEAAVAETHANDAPAPAPAPAAPASSKNPFTEKFKQHVVDTLEAWKCPGMSIAIIDGQDIFTESFGYAKLPGVKATNDALWYIGSCTKAFTGALMAKMVDSKAQFPALADRGWSTTMSSLIRDDFVLQDEWATGHVTIEDASSHVTGMNQHDVALLKEVTDRDGTRRPATLRDHVRQMRHLRMGDEPRRRFIYSNHMYMALSLVAETVTGEPLGDALREHVWRPLGMHATYMGDEEAAAGEKGTLATAYSWDGGAGAYAPLPAETVTELRGTGAVISTAADMARWLRCLLTEGEALSPAVHADIRRPRALVTTAPADGNDIMTYGLGWLRTVYQGQVLYSHAGGTSTQGSETFWLPELGFGFVAMGNAPGASNHAARVLAYGLMDERIGVPEGKRQDFSALLKAQEQSDKAAKDTAMETLFPNRPSPPLPSPLPAADLAGAYRDAGYGTLVFAAAPHPTSEGETMLQAERLEGFIRMRVRLVHATGLHWLVYMKSVDEDEESLSVTLRAEFRVSGDGRAEALEVDFTNEMLGVMDGKVLFERVSG